MKTSSETQLIRELLQYVPQFAGKIFAFDLPWHQLSDIQKSEVMLDITSLQSLAVKIFLAVDESSVEDFENWAIDFDLKLAKKLATSTDEALAILNRGQAAIVGSKSDNPLNDSFCEIVKLLEPSKVVALVAESKPVKFTPGLSLSLAEWDKSHFKTESYFEGVKQLLAAGIQRVHLLDARAPSVILDELFSSEGAGLMIYRNGYRKIRSIQSEDIPELLTLIGRSVRNSLLVPRIYEEIEEQISDYYVFEIDNNVVGCCALHQYGEGWAEVACLYVKQGHDGRGYGIELVKYMEGLAAELGVSKLFALTTGASVFFSEKLGYREIPVSQIPASRYEALKNSGRGSKAFLQHIKE